MPITLVINVLKKKIEKNFFLPRNFNHSSSCVCVCFFVCRVNLIAYKLVNETKKHIIFCFIYYFFNKNIKIESNLYIITEN